MENVVVPPEVFGVRVDGVEIPEGRRVGLSGSASCVRQRCDEDLFVVSRTTDRLHELLSFAHHIHFVILEDICAEDLLRQLVQGRHGGSG